MAKRSSKHTQEQIVRMSDFSGGLNLSINEEAIADNELSQAENWEYTYPTGKLKTREGTILFKDTTVNVDNLFYADNVNFFMFSVGTTLYKFVGGVATNIGTATGSEVPAYALWSKADGTKYVLIASGGSVQSYDGTTLANTGSPNADIIFTRVGRVVIARSGYDKLVYSGVGDETNWTVSGNDADSIEIDVGQNDGGDIIGVTPLASDIVVYKSSGSIFRVVSEYPDWAVYEVTRTQLALSRFAMLQVANNAYFLTSHGFMSLQAVTEYGNIQTSEEGYKVNSSISEVVDAGARMWHVPSKGQIWVRPEVSEYIWVFHTINKAWTKFKMAGTVTGVTEIDGGEIYISIGTKIFTIGDTQDEDVDYSCYMKGKKYVARYAYLIKRTTVEYFRHTSATGALSFGLLSIPFDIPSSGDIAHSDTDIAYSDDDALVELNENKLDSRSSYRTEYLEPFINIDSGSITIKEIILNIAEV